jgi:Putative Flp pilus-assembly TadE/G-like
MRSTVPSTRVKSPQRKLQDGQAIVLIALLILVLFGMLGLAIDSGRSYVDRRDQQSAVDAAALAAGDWYDNFPNIPDLSLKTIPQSRQVYENNLHLYGGVLTESTSSGNVGANNAFPQNTWTDTFAGGYTLKITATNTIFNGYQFQFDSRHDFPLAFLQIFGGPPNVTIKATASAIVGNQRQTPALLTLSNLPCATQLQGNGSLTMLGDAYTNGTECQQGSSTLDLAGNCYGGTGSQCSSAVYYCFSATPGIPPYDPATTGGACLAGDTTGRPVVPAPILPDPGYLAPSLWAYSSPGFALSRGTYTELAPGSYNNFTLNGGSACYFLDAGIYTWNGGYTSHGGFVSNELKSPNEEYVQPSNPLIGPGTTALANPQFWPSNCVGGFTAASVSVSGGNGMKHGAGGGTWGIELTAVRHDTFNDSTITAPNPVALCAPVGGCRRESAPSACVPVSTTDDTTGPQGININITKNSPGAQFYNVYINPFGCLPYVHSNGTAGTPNDFSFVDKFTAPGFPYPNGGSGTTLIGGIQGWPCPVATVTICNVDYGQLTTTNQCFAQSRAELCQAPDDETPPQCITTCPANTLPQDNAAMGLQYPPNSGGDVANENYCVISPNPGDFNAPCSTAKVTPGGVQFYFPPGQCLSQNGNGTTHVFGGEQYNWIIIYQAAGAAPPPVSCANNLNGSAFTQYIGTIYSPTADWTVSGTDTAPLAGQVIAWSATVIGNNTTGILFNPNYSPAPPAARLIN